MFPNQLDVATTRRLSIGLLATAGATFLAALELYGMAIGSQNGTLAIEVSKSIKPLAFSASSGLVSLLMTELAAHRNTPREGHPHSKRNYLQTAFALLVVFGLFNFFFGGFMLVSATQ